MDHKVTVRLLPVERARKDELARMMGAYVEELSVYAGSGADADAPEALGPHFEAYWTEDGRHPFFILADGQVAGFCMVRLIEPGLHSIAEFWVSPDFRGRGIGRRAATLVFRLFGGRWQVAELDANIPAQDFWRAVIAEASGGDFTEGRSEAEPEGPMQSFSVPGG